MCHAWAYRDSTSPEGTFWKEGDGSRRKTHREGGEWLVFDGQLALAPALKVGLLPHDFGMTRESG